MVESGSFRDAANRVFYRDGRVLRSLDEHGLADWEALSASPLFSELVEEGKLVETVRADDVDPALDGLHRGVVAVLEHARVPFVSYPYEWPFGMLQDAALLQLELVRRSIGAGLMLKDSTPYNVQWRGASPVFIDVGSFESLVEGEPWAGYRQFCMLFLYPLLMQAHCGIPFQPWLRGSLAGITPSECAGAFSGRHRFHRGVLTHVTLHSRLERRYAEAGGELKQELRTAGFRKELILANVTKLEKLVRRLEWHPGGSAWSGYEATTSYTEADAREKERIVARVVAAEQPSLVWDLGCNEGRHARIAADTADVVVALDSDAAVVDRLYHALREEGRTNVLPLVGNVVDPSPALGWRGLERQPLRARGAPDLTLALALVHHVVITGNVPVDQFLDWLRGLGGALLIEFPTPEDPMVRRLLERKRAHDHPDYRTDWFERCLGERFELVSSELLAGGARRLYHARPRL
jgi:SAM-dependent methyltransferase